MQEWGKEAKEAILILVREDKEMIKTEAVKMEVVKTEAVKMETETQGEAAEKEDLSPLVQKKPHPTS